MSDLASLPNSSLRAVPGAAIATFLMTDIEGSTRLWEEHPATMPDLLAAHDAILRAAVEDRAGTVVKTTGDGLLARFDDPTSCLTAAVDGQIGLAGLARHPVAPLRVRMAIHTGTAQARDGDYFGPALNRVARLLAIGHGGQVLVSGVAAVLLGEQLPAAVELLDLGNHRLRDLEQVEHAFQLAAPGLPREFPPLRSLGSTRTNLPAQTTSFVGRELELADLRRLFVSSRLVTLTGTGGTGKTRLMLQAAAGLVVRYRDGVWLAELAPIRDPGLVAQGVAGALGVREQPGATPVEAVVDYLRQKELVLLLDNCEHLVDAAADLVHRLLADCPSLTIVTTSREALGIPGEAIFQVPSLGVPEALQRFEIHAEHATPSLEQAAGSDAVRLFVDRAMASEPTFALTTANAPAIVEICRRLDGIPLAIELAAARVTVLSVEEILQRLGDRFRLLTGGRRMAVPRQQTLQALIDWSWDLLDEGDRRLLRRLSVFAGGWTLEVAAAVCGDEGEDAADTLDGLGRLAERSLVVVDRGATTRYRLLETIRQYARERLVETGEADLVQARHLDHFVRLAERAEPAMRGPDMVDCLRRLDADADNMRTAIEWALEIDPQRAARIAVALMLYWQTRSTWMESSAWLTEAVDRVRMLPLASHETQHQRDKLVANLMADAAFARSTFLGGDTSALADEAIELARRSGDDAVLLEVLARAGAAKVFSGAWGGLDVLGREAIRLATEQGSDFHLAMMEGSVANQLAMEDPAGALVMLEAATDHARRSGNPFVIGFAALGRARVLSRNGRLDEALPFFDESFAGFAELNDPYFPMMSRSDLAHALRLGGRLDEAEATYRETIHGWENFGNRGAIANQLEGFGFLAVARGETERAARLLGAAERLREAAAAHMMPWEQRDYEAAVARLTEAMDPAGLERAWTAGRSMGVTDAVAFALGDHPTTEVPTR